MCIVCVLLNKEKITKSEAKRALWEEINNAKTTEDIEHIQALYTELNPADDSD